jgi:hypothetical protein
MAEIHGDTTRAIRESKGIFLKSMVTSPYRDGTGF